jgi:hypothetical protein
MDALTYEQRMKLRNIAEDSIHVYVGLRFFSGVHIVRPLAAKSKKWYNRRKK